jgi:hypothetical protein
MRLLATDCRFAVALAVLAMGGCGSEFSPAEGVVTLNGAPLANATVVFQSPARPLATAKTDNEGCYRVETGSIEGIKPGEYRVAVTAYRKCEGYNDDNAPELAVPEKYVQPETSGLTAVIISGSNRGVNFDLTTQEVTTQ